MILNRLLLISVFCCFVVNADSQQFPWNDHSLSTELRVEKLIDALTTDEKISLLMYNNPPIERLNIPEYNWWNEALHGVARNGHATVFPQAINLASTFNDSLIKEIADCISTEARAKYNIARRSGNYGQYAGLTFWSPNINIFRDPRWGRGQETYGEDPYLTSRMGVAFVKGLQGDDPSHLKVAACAKHYAVHSGPESQRHSFNAIPGLKDFHETYLPAFAALVREANVAGVMCAYNRVFGEPCCASDTLLKSILRTKWGFRGYVVSDCAAISDIYYHHQTAKTPEEAAAAALNAGVNLDCGSEFQYLKTALENKLITPDAIDTALRPLLELRVRLGNLDEFGTHALDNLDEKDIRTEHSIEQACNAAAKSVVLLKNDNILPLSRENLHSVALLGPLASNELVLLGNYSGMSPSLITIKTGITAAIDSAITLHSNDAFTLTGESADYETSINEVKNSDVIIVTLGLNSSFQGENGDTPFSTDGGDYLSLEIPIAQLEFLRQLRRATEQPIVALIFSGGPLLLEEVESLCDGILWCGYPGEQGGRAITELLFGQRNPSGKLPYTIPKSIDQLPAFDDYSMKNRTYRFMDSEPLFPFGYGLSYTHFTYSNVKVTSEKQDGHHALNISMQIQNDGKFDGDEIIQIYLRKSHPKRNDPYNHLIAFKSVYLTKNESKEVSLTLSPESFVSYKENGEAYVEKGQYIIGFISIPRKDNEELRLHEQTIVIR